MKADDDKVIAKERLKNIWQVVTVFFRFAIPIAIVVGLIWSAYWFVKDGYKQIFEPQKEIVSAKLTDADTVIIEREKRCASDYSDFSAIVDRISHDAKSYSYNIESSAPIQFSINLPDAELTVVKYSGDTIINDASIPVKPGVGYKGTIKSLSIQITQMQVLSLQQFYCARIVKFLPIGGIVLSSPDGSNLQINTVQGFNTGDTLKIVIEPIDINGFGNQKYDKIELNLNVTEDLTAMGISTISPSLNTTLPGVGKDQFGIWKNDADNFFAAAESVKVENPAGSIQLGNNPPIEILKLAHLADESLEFPRMSDNSNDAYKVTSNITDGVYEISGNTQSVILNGQELSKSYWDAVPDYIKAGLFGLLLSIAGGLWAFRQFIWQWLLSPFPFLKPNYNPPQGSYVLVMVSGVVIAGELSRPPTKNYPYYLIKNARRKLSLSGQWEKELVPEIKVRSDAVEQSYVE